MCSPISLRALGSYSFLRLARSGFLSLLILSLLTGSLAAQGDKGMPALELGKPVERELVGGKAHSYVVVLTAGQYLRAVVDQRGIDVVVTLFRPNDEKLKEVDSPNGTQGPEPVSFVIEASGNYRLEVRALEKNAPAGRYEVRIEELRAATTQDRSRVAAEQAFAQAEALRVQGTEELLRQSVKKYEESLPLYRAAGDRRGEAKAVNNIGVVHSALGEKRRALESYQQALTLWRAVKDQRGEATTLSNIGAAHSSLGEVRQALDDFAQALQLFHAVGDRWGEATTLSHIGLSQTLLREQRRALDSHTQSLTLYRALGDQRGQALALNNIGAVYNDLGESQHALDSYQQTLELYRAFGDRHGEATTLNNIGAIYSSRGEKRKALDNYTQALELFRALGDQSASAVATLLNNIGAIYSSMGEPQQALDHFTRAIPLRKAVGDIRGEATTLNNIGLVQSSIGEQHLALDYFLRAIKLWRADGDRGGEAATLGNVGTVHYELGEVKRALDDFAQALPLYRLVGDRHGEATTLNNIGLAQSSLGEERRALESYAQSLEIFRDIGGRADEATALNNIGAVQSSQGEKRKALNNYTRALELFRAALDRDSEATALNNIAAIYYELGEPQRALDNFAEVLRLYRAAGDRSGEATALSNSALVERVMGNQQEALTRIRAALQLVESLRTKVFSQELRTSYFATVQDYYEFNIDLLMRLHKQQPSAGYDVEALQVSERARARGLLDLLTEAQVDVREGVDSALIERERAVRQKLNAKAQRQAELLNGPYDAEHAVAISGEIKELTAELQLIEGQVRQASPRYAELTQPRPLALREIQTQVLDANTMLLEYSLGAERSYLWAVTPTSIKSYELPKRVEVETAARLFHDLLASSAPAHTDDGDRKLLGTASRLSRMLLGPVASRLGRKRLLIVTDGALQYVPFAALPDPAPNVRDLSGKMPLVMRHAVVGLPSVSILPALRGETVDRSPAPQTIAVLADPVFSPDDERVKRDSTPRKTVQPNPSSAADGNPIEEVGGSEQEVRNQSRVDFERLPGSRREAQKIFALAPAKKARLALDFDASRALAVSSELSRYRYVHFATHGRVDDLHPELSAVVLSLVDENGNSQNGYLRLNEVFNLRLSADAVVLSGCETGLGKEIRGEGLIGLTRGLMYAGAAQVMASLWRVDDEAATELMVSLYKRILGQGKRPAEALREAQIEMARRKRWRSPHHWAAFVIQGDWK